MKIKLNDTYVNQHVVTCRGFTLVQGESKEANLNDGEVKEYLRQGIFVKVEDMPKEAKIEPEVEEPEVEEPKVEEVKIEETKEEIKMIIKDDIQKSPIKEIVNESNNVKEILKEEQDGNKEEEMSYM